MKRIAIFGKPGSGKSTVSRRLSALTGLPLYHLDSIQYSANGKEVDRDTYLAQHSKLIESESWIIDGLGPLRSFDARLDAADTCIYIDLPYATSYYFVTIRFLKGLFKRPYGWPKGSSILKGTIQSYKTLRLCPAFWNAEFEAQLKERFSEKQLIIIRSRKALAALPKLLKTSD